MISPAAAGEGTTSYRALWSVPGFPRLAAGTLLVRAAASMWQLALVLFVLLRYDSPGLAGLAMFLSIAPGVIVSPLAGALLDRHGRVRLMAADYVISAAALTLLVVAGGPEFPLAAFLALVALASLANPLGTAGARALFPRVVPPRLWDRSNALDSVGYTLTTVVGPPLAGTIVAFSSPEAAILLTAGIFLAGAVTIVGVRDVADRQAAPRSVVAEAAAGLGYVLRHPTLRGLAIGISVMNLATGILFVAIPVLVLQRLGGDAAQVGGLWAVLGLAGVLTGLVVGRLGTIGRERRLLALTAGSVGVGCAVLAGAETLVVVVMGIVIVGAAFGSLDVALFSLRQRVTDPAWFGRAFAVSMHLNYSGVPLGSALSGVLLGWSVPVALVAASGFALGGALLLRVLLPPHPAPPPG